ncbi:HAD family hydrolase [Streptomyces albipurpureus]|uniref:HAD hydrolase-like protein n=1 Tax=Streptomyces albipurpureus TaxID=2897419 RepID=A0ABT0UUR6_9ACTN|nr:HAD hydrolase-like protein [Streptomyces sp. CWNU-1]MCM2392313.1 HAD hydrolase-like protein [Streptomyces sp. CWNU-1]
MGKRRGTHDAHLIWDWNGTLLDDITAVIGATNAAFADIGLEPITLERYREMYCVPVPRFYERLLGRLPTDEEWELMDVTFHRYYSEHRLACGLTQGAEELLGEWRRAGRSQSLLSLYGHDELVPIVRGYGIESHFIRVEGRRGRSGGSKAIHMEAHLAALIGTAAPERTVVIGDAADDAIAAAHVGARAVLYTGGSHSRASLELVGVPVVDTLEDAVEAALRLVA